MLMNSVNQNKTKMVKIIAQKNIKKNGIDTIFFFCYSKVIFFAKNSYFAFTRQESTTCLIPGIVIEVSAIFVAKTIFLQPSLVIPKTPF